MIKAIVIEDDRDIAELIELHVEDMGGQVEIFTNGKEGYREALKSKFDILVLDINLPEMNGIEICRNLRDKGINLPILMLTARSQEMDKVCGLEIGADDYMTKPFSVRELIARIKAILRRVETDTKNEVYENIEYNDLIIDKQKHKVLLNNQRVELTPKEFELLYLLASNPGVTYDRKTLLNLVWGYDFEGYEHTVNSHINRLRSKIEKDPANPGYILTTWGVGYRFADN